MTLFKWQPAWGRQDVEIKETDSIYQGFYELKKVTLRHRCFSGEWSPWVIREQIHHSDAAAVLLYDKERDKLVMIEQFRVPILRYPEQSPWLLEIVAGLIEPGEQAKQTVLREAKEEAGCHIQTLFAIGEFYNSPGGFVEKTSLFCGLIDSHKVEGTYGIAAEHEDIKVHVMAADAVVTALEEGHLITSASTVIALQWFKHNKLKLSSLLPLPASD